MRAEDEEEKESRERQVRYEIVQKVGCEHREKVQRRTNRCQANRTKNIVGKVSSKAGIVHRLKNEEEDEKGARWKCEWAADEKLEEALERRRMEGNCFAGRSHAKGT